MMENQQTNGTTKSRAFPKWVIVLLLAAGVALALYAKEREKRVSLPQMQAAATSVSPQNTAPPADSGAKEITAETASGKTSEPPAQLPRLIELGSVRCIPCKMMAPILDDLKKRYDGKLKVEFVDVWENPSAAEQFRVRAIPTQVFVDSSGKEVYRHTGFFPKEELVAKLQELKLVPKD